MAHQRITGKQDTLGPYSPWLASDTSLLWYSQFVLGLKVTRVATQLNPHSGRENQ